MRQISALYVNFHFHQLLTADDSCHKKNLNGIFIYSLNVMSVPSLSSAGCLGAQLESVTDRRQTDATQTDRQTPGEYSANSGPAWLVPGPELSNKKLLCHIDNC